MEYQGGRQYPRSAVFGGYCPGQQPATRTMTFSTPFIVPTLVPSHTLAASPGRLRNGRHKLLAMNRLKIGRPANVFSYMARPTDRSIGGHVHVHFACRRLSLGLVARRVRRTYPSCATKSAPVRSLTIRSSAE
jgi:hypothetical protein